MLICIGASVSRGLTSQSVEALISITEPVALLTSLYPRRSSEYPQPISR